MRLLLDNNLSPRLVGLLEEAGWNVVHIRDLGLQRAPDQVVLATARDSRRVLLSADTDFGQLLARSHATSPSVVLLRRVAGRRLDDLAAVLLENLPGLEPELAQGSVVAIGESSIRVRRLPLG